MLMLKFCDSDCTVQLMYHLCFFTEHSWVKCEKRDSLLMNTRKWRNQCRLVVHRSPCLYTQTLWSRCMCPRTSLMWLLMFWFHYNPHKHPLHHQPHTPLQLQSRVWTIDNRGPGAAAGAEAGDRNLLQLGLALMRSLSITPCHCPCVCQKKSISVTLAARPDWWIPRSCSCLFGPKSHCVLFTIASAEY